MTDDLRALYEDVVLEHGRHPRNRRSIAEGHHAEQHNRMCGDRIIVYVRVEHDVIRDVSFEGSACAIAVASASLMTEVVRDQTVGHADVFAERLRRMLMQAGEGTFDGLGSLVALAGVRQFPLRVRCACLPWEALKAAIERAERTEQRR